MGEGIMGRVKIGNTFEVDSDNITGKRLAEIGRWALTGKQIVDEQIIENIYKEGYRNEGDYTDIGWLDMRVNEVCKRGRL
jgi:hypothetical protein